MCGNLVLNLIFLFAARVSFSVPHVEFPSCGRFFALISILTPGLEGSPIFCSCSVSVLNSATGRADLPIDEGFAQA
jgi:hypothetical protein